LVVPAPPTGVTVANASQEGLSAITDNRYAQMFPGQTVTPNSNGSVTVTTTVDGGSASTTYATAELDQLADGKLSRHWREVNSRGGHLFDATNYDVLGTQGFSGFTDQVTQTAPPSAPDGAVFNWGDADMGGSALPQAQLPQTPLPPSSPSSNAFADDVSHRQTLLAMGMDPNAAPQEPKAPVQGILGHYVIAQSGDTASTLMGSSNPQAVGAFLAGNDLPRSDLRAGSLYFIPNDINAFGDTTQRGQSTLDTDNQRLADLASQQRGAARPEPRWMAPLVPQDSSLSIDGSGPSFNSMSASAPSMFDETQSTPPQGVVPERNVTDRFATTAEGRDYRSSVAAEKTRVESRLNALGWGADPAEFNEIAALNERRNSLAAQLEQIDTRLRLITPFSDWTPEELHRTNESALLTLGGIGGSIAVGSRMPTSSDLQEARIVTTEVVDGQPTRLASGTVDPVMLKGDGSFYFVSKQQNALTFVNDLDSITTNVEVGTTPGRLDIVSHSTPTSITVGGENMDASQFASLLRQNGALNGYSCVRLYACSAGAEVSDGLNFAQHFANEVGMPVSAATKDIWEIGGRLYVADDLRYLSETNEWLPVNPGEFVDFTPGRH